jgi:hypothetical protein
MTLWRYCLLVWVLVTILIIGADVFAQKYAIDGPPPDGTTPTMQFVGFLGLAVELLLVFPIVIPRVYALHLLTLTGTLSYEQINGSFFLWFVGGVDLLVCLAYLLVLRAIFLLFRVIAAFEVRLSTR